MSTTLTKPKSKPKTTAKTVVKPKVTPRAKSDSPKAQAKYMINKLPDDVTWEQIQYHVYVLEKIARGEKDVENGRIVSHEDAKKRFEKWFR